MGKVTVAETTNAGPSVGWLRRRYELAFDHVWRTEYIAYVKVVAMGQKPIRKTHSMGFDTSYYFEVTHDDWFGSYKVYVNQRIHNHINCGDRILIGYKVGRFSRKIGKIRRV